MTFLSEESVNKIREKFSDYKVMFPMIPLNGEHLEHRLYDAFIDSNYSVEWNPKSHCIGADFVCPDFEDKNWSIKSGRFTNITTNLLVKITSFRTTSHRTIEEKKEFLKQQHEDIILSVTYDDRKKITKPFRELGIERYYVFLFKPPIFGDEEWIETFSHKHHTSTGWKTVLSDGTQATISKQCSDQLSFHIPACLAKECYEIIV